MTMVGLSTLTMHPDAYPTVRIGVARLLKFAFDGNDLTPLRTELQADLQDPGAAMDLSIVEQILGHLDAGLEIQQEALKRQRLYRSPGCAKPPRLRVLALAAPLDVGGNTPVEFLITEPDVELTTLYVVPGHPIEPSLPDHDIAIVVMSEGDDAAASLQQVMSVAPMWPRPLLNAPERIALTERDRLFELIQTVPGLDIPVNRRVSRQQLADIARKTKDVPEGVQFPMVVRPVGSHAGRGLEKLDSAADIAAYLDAQSDADFFLMRFVDYSGNDGQFRKYRVVYVDGRPFACHMAIADQWKIWYLNADMFASPAKRAEEARFMEHFDEEFGLRHKAALLEVAARVGLDYFSIDCGETKDGKLLIFEAGVAMVVHDMDSADLYPYKPPQMKKVFEAFAAMLDRRSGAPHTPMSDNSA
jgi:hypothetical protein